MKPTEQKCITTLEHITCKNSDTLIKILILNPECRTKECKRKDPYSVNNLAHNGVNAKIL